MNVAEQQAADAVRVHPLVHTFKWLVSDLLSTLAFVAIYAVFHSITLAVGFGIALGIAQIGYLRWRGSRIEPLQWMSLGLVLVFGGAALLTNNPKFVLVKPTLIYTAVGVVMLRPGWMNRYIHPAAHGRSEDVTFVFGYVWAGLMFLTAAFNLVLALYAPMRTYVWFLSVFPLSSKFALTGVQYVVTRSVVRRRMRAEQEVGAASA